MLDVLDGAVERGSPVLANRLLARLKHFFKWTVERGILDDSPVLGLRPPPLSPAVTGSSQMMNFAPYGRLQRTSAIRSALRSNF